MKQVKKIKGTVYKKDKNFRDHNYMNRRLKEFIKNNDGFRWSDFSDVFGQGSDGTIRNWRLNGIPENQLLFVHLLLEKYKH